MRQTPLKSSGSTGRIEIVRKGKPVDPDDFKGVWRMRLPVPRGGDG